MFGHTTCALAMLVAIGVIARLILKRPAIDRQVTFGTIVVVISLLWDLQKHLGWSSPSLSLWAGVMALLLTAVSIYLSIFWLLAPIDGKVKEDHPGQSS